MTQSDKHIDWQAIRERLKRDDGAEKMWRSLEELAQDEVFRRHLPREFEQGAEFMRDPITRRRFLQLAAASLGLAGLTACVGQPAERILPYVDEPADFTPGQSRFFATAHLLGGYGEGLLAESHEGRPTRVAGNELHPSSLGASDAFAQASILSLYDPERARRPLLDGEPASWGQFERALQDALRQSEGRLRLLTTTVTSPTLARQIEQVLQAFPRARWLQNEPFNWDNAYEGARLAFGAPVQPVYHFDAAAVILSLDADFLFTLPGRLRYARDFSRRRALTDPDVQSMNRLYAVSPTPTLTSSMADHHWPLHPSDVETLARLVARELGLDTVAEQASELEAIAATIAADLQDAGEGALVLAGMGQPPQVHALAYAMNEALGGAGSTVTYIEAVPARVAPQQNDLRVLVQEMDAGEVDALLIVEGDPAYTAPPDVPFASALARVPFTAHLGYDRNETSALCQWRLPQTHYLETWSDARAYDGTATVMQPLIEPLFDVRSAHELLAIALGGEAQAREPLDIVRRTWQAQVEEDGEAFEAFWRRALHEGVVPQSAFQAQDVALVSDFDPAA